MQVLGERVERYDLLKNLTCARDVITFRQIAKGSMDNVKIELEGTIAKNVKRNSVNIASEGDWEPSPLNHHQVVKLAVYSEAVYDVFDAVAIPNAMTNNLAVKLRFGLSPTKRRIVVLVELLEVAEGRYQ